MMCSVLMAVSLSSCNGDEPIVTDEVTKSDLTSPMFLFVNQKADLATLQNGFSFYSFTNDKAAKGTFTTMGLRPFIKCEGIYDWNVEKGKITIGSTSNTVAMVNVLGVKAYGIGATIYIPSNNTLAGNFKAEDIFTKINYDKNRLWRALEAAKANGQGVYMDEVE